MAKLFPQLHGTVSVCNEKQQVDDMAINIVE